jgi:GTP pyrophosphokinase
MATTALGTVIPGWALDDAAAVERLDGDLLARAYRFSERAHAGQKRSSGEAYVSHCVEVAKILAELHLDSVTVASGLIHDVIEDTGVSVQELEREFGGEIASIVDGVTKIGNITFRSTQERQVENYRKLLLSIAKDARVILIKLADRLHNMRTLDYLPEEKRRRIAQETMDLYAPLAHRFGMAKLRWELEDLSFKHLEPDGYKSLAKLVAAKRAEREGLIAQMRDPIERVLRDAGLTHAEVTGRPKHLWSIFKKMRQRERPYEEIYDLMAIRVLVNSVPECYHALGLIHEGWTPLQERIKDYIAQPKSNGYQSLHTTIFGPGKQLFEIQIRTRDMHRTAEFGIAAHWLYKESARGRDDLDEKLGWFREILAMQLDAKTPDEFLEFLKLDLYQDEIFVFTPTGDVIQLPKGATPIDFAFAVHTEVGYHCSGAKVNGRIAPLSRDLRNGDTVEVLTDARQRPSRDWLAFVKTARARQKIRQWIKQEEVSAATDLGKDLLDREIRKLRKGRPTEAQLLDAAKSLGQMSVEAMYGALGRGDIGPTAILRELFPGEEPPQRKEPTALERFVDRMRGDRGVKIQGVDNMMVRYSQCCQPVPGDEVIGYITRGRGISIHRSDCPNILNLADHPERRVEIDWAAEANDRFFVRLVVEGTDRRGLLSDIATAITTTGTNIQAAEIKAVEGGMNGAFVVEVHDLTHLKKVIKSVRKVNGVLSVERKEHFLGAKEAVEVEETE